MVINIHERKVYQGHFVNAVLAWLQNYLLLEAKENQQYTTLLDKLGRLQLLAAIGNSNVEELCQRNTVSVDAYKAVQGACDIRFTMATEVKEWFKLLYRVKGWEDADSREMKIVFILSEYTYYDIRQIPNDVLWAFGECPHVEVSVVQEGEVVQGDNI